MAKLLLVEDDNNLREIYEARLGAEGYEIATAQNGEEALSIAKDMHPDLIISDVMMPRISGFEMLDILRNTDELRNTKIIMLTALGQADDRGRADNLGADKYLVKSQVTLEDIVQAAHDLLAGTTAQPVATPSAPPEPVADVTIPEPTPLEQPVPVTPAPVAPVTTPAFQPPQTPTPTAPIAFAPPVAAAPTPVEPVAAVPTATFADQRAVAEANSIGEEEAAIQKQIQNFADEPVEAPVPAPLPEAVPAPTPEAAAPFTPPVEPVAPATPTPPAVLAHDNVTNDAVLVAAIDKLTQPAAAPPTTPAPVPDTLTQPTPSPTAETVVPQATPTNPSEPTGRKVISPITDPAAAPNLDDLLAKEEVNETINATVDPSDTVSPSPTSDAPIQPPGPGDSIDPNSIAL